MSPWQRAEKTAENECPYPERGEGFALHLRRQRSDWVFGFCVGWCGIPESELYRTGGREYEEGRKAGAQRVNHAPH